METVRTSNQHKRLHGRMALLYPKHLIGEMKQSLALEYSKGRTSHTSELTEEECEKLIQSLAVAQQKQPTEITKAMRKLFAIRNSLGWSYERLSEFIKEQTHGKKNHTRQLNDAEVNKLVSVMEKIEVSNLKTNKR